MYSLARASPASKWVLPFCSGKPCFATFSLWKLKKTKRPKKRERPVLRLMTIDGFSSARIAVDRFEVDRIDRAENECNLAGTRRREIEGELTDCAERKVEVAMGGWFLFFRITGYN
jgi:hypothetical protein